MEEMDEIENSKGKAYQGIATEQKKVINSTKVGCVQDLEALNSFNIHQGIVQLDMIDISGQT